MSIAPPGAVDMCHITTAETRFTGAEQRRLTFDPRGTLEATQ